MFKDQNLTLSLAAPSSLAHILRQVKWWPVTLVKRYEVGSGRWSSHFWVKMHLFQLVLTIKAKLAVKMRQSTFFMFYLKCQSAKKLPILSLFTWFLIIIIIIVILPCRAVDRKFPPPMTVLSHFQQLIVICQAIRIPRKTMNIIGEQGSLSSGFPPPMSGKTHCKFSDRLIFRQAAERMTKETQLPKPDFFNKGSCFCDAVDGSSWYPVDSPDV